MPPEHRQIDLDLPPAAPPADDVVEFGGDARPARRRWSPAGLGRSLLTDRRTVPLAAVLGAVAVLASLISEWQITTVDSEEFGGEVGAHPIATDVTDLGALGTGYLVGLFPLVCAVVLTMFGPAAGRRWARLTGMSVAGTMLGLLFATAASLGSQSRPLPDLYKLQFDQDQVQFAYGRGLWCAVIGVLLAMAALYLADRHQPAPAAFTAADALAGGDESAWRWRRPPAARAEERPADQPLELTVGPAKPFTSLGDDRDKPGPSGRRGISG
ncbi:hypothetical protein ACFQS1_22145 [Paractinoplanes rhizophilus]|jgi:hypothetical protein|uniref:Membrane protein (TIGR02234 family) n=1 Tax=Paractinoplanes rhizophilus TaxID=1416877 RepID=A0ABW2HY33_9ACTN|nr:hypothetical protein [Actinoplanes sp.]